uniref:Uncharacterized protein n=1 Tax=Arion vulgaris TaxID=1028688 RepID=A0A0B6YQA6_9EUPU
MFRADWRHFFSDICVVDEELTVCYMNADPWGHSVNYYSGACSSEQDQESETELKDNGTSSSRPTFDEVNDAVKTLCYYVQPQQELNFKTTTYNSGASCICKIQS